MGIERILASSERDFVAKSVDYIEEGVLQGGGEGRPAVLLGEGRWFQCISNVFHAEKTAKYLTRGEVVDGVTPKWRRLVRGHDKNNYMGSWAESTFQVVYIYMIYVYFSMDHLLSGWGWVLKQVRPLESCSIHEGIGSLTSPKKNIYTQTRLASFSRPQKNGFREVFSPINPQDMGISRIHA